MHPPVPQYIEAAEEHEKRVLIDHRFRHSVSGEVHPLHRVPGLKGTVLKALALLAGFFEDVVHGTGDGWGRPQQEEANARCLIPLLFPAGSRAALSDLDAVSDGFDTQRKPY